MDKGEPILLEGMLDLNQWEKDGKKFSKLSVIVERFEYISKKEPVAKKSGVNPDFNEDGFTPDESDVLPF